MKATAAYSSCRAWLIQLVEGAEIDRLVVVGGSDFSAVEEVDGAVVRVANASEIGASIFPPLSIVCDCVKLVELDLLGPNPRDFVPGEGAKLVMPSRGVIDLKEMCGIIAGRIEDDCFRGLWGENGLAVNLAEEFEYQFDTVLPPGSKIDDQGKSQAVAGLRGSAVLQFRVSRCTEGSVVDDGGVRFLRFSPEDERFLHLLGGSLPKKADVRLAGGDKQLPVVRRPTRRFEGARLGFGSTGRSGEAASHLIAHVKGDGFHWQLRVFSSREIASRVGRRVWTGGTAVRVQGAR